MAPGQPLISVLMAVYNREKYLQQAIDSIRQQTYTSWELVCVDDGSTDSSPEILAEAAAKDNRIRVISSEENRGLPCARNLGIAHVTGDYVAIFDSDDIAYPDRLARSLAAFERHPDIDIVGSGALQIDETGKEVGRWHLGRAVHSSVMFRTAVLRTAGGYDEFFTTAEAHELMLRLRKIHGCKFYYIRKPLIKARWHGEQLSVEMARERMIFAQLAHAKVEGRLRGRQIDKQTEYARIAGAPETEVWTHYTAALIAIQTNQRQEARKHFAVLSTTGLSPAMKCKAAVCYLLSFLPTTVFRWLFDLWRTYGYAILA